MTTPRALHVYPPTPQGDPDVYRIDEDSRVLSLGPTGAAALLSDVPILVDGTLHAPGYVHQLRALSPAGMVRVAAWRKGGTFAVWPGTGRSSSYGQPRG